jgi:hypothetical protein
VKLLLESDKLSLGLPFVLYASGKGSTEADDMHCSLFKLNEYVLLEDSSEFYEFSIHSEGSLLVVMALVYIEHTI